MAGDSDNTKQVFFIGAWRTQHVSDQLLRQISNQIASKKKAATQLTITSEGLELLILNATGQVTRKDKIALENVVDFIDNKYSTTCTMAIVRDKQQKVYTVFVFLCKSDRDAASLIHTFKTTKRQLSGEGYNTTLTPKGTNWTLIQKSEKSVHKTSNGDAGGHTVVNVPGNDVRIINTEKQNGTVTVINTGDRHDSFSRESVRTSDSEVKEELHQLADEVRGIKKLLQGSKGRSQFEKHYGYRILQDTVPEEKQVEYINRNVNVRPAEPTPGNIYVKNEANVRYRNGGSQVIRVGGGATRSTRRLKGNAHYVTATSPTRVDYTKRVYDSANPYVETGSRIKPVMVSKRKIRPVIVPTQRLYQPLSQSTDIVHKNIEDVYKSRSLRRIYLPPQSPNGKTVEYVNSQSVHHDQQQPRQLPVKVLHARENDQPIVRVKNTPEIRTYYEPKEEQYHPVETNSSNVSKNVKIIVNKNSEDSEKHTESSLVIGEQNATKYENTDNVTVVKAVQIDPRSNYRETDKNVVVIQNNYTSQQNEPVIVGGDVYHVRAEFAEDYEKSLENDEHVTVIRSTGTQQEDIKVNEITNEIENSTEVKHTAENHGGEGLFGAYTKIVDEHDEPGDEIVTEKAYRYHDNEDELIIEENKADQLHSVKEDAGLFGAYAKEPEEIEGSGTEIIKRASYRYRENEISTVENRNENIVDEDIKEIVDEKRVRYNDTVEQIPLNDNELEHITEKITRTDDVYEVHKENADVSQDQFRNELGAVVSRIRHNYDEKIKEDERHDIEDNGDEKEYKFDMEALKAFSMEPDIIILDAENENKVESVSADNKQFVNEELNREVLKRGEDNVEISRSENSVEIQIEPEQSVITENDANELISRTVTGDDAHEFISKTVSEDDAHEFISKTVTEDDAHEFISQTVTEDDAHEFISKSVTENDAHEFISKTVTEDDAHEFISKTVTENDAHEFISKNVTEDDVHEFISKTEDSVLF